MDYTSVYFFVFLFAILIIYYLLNKWWRWQNVILLIGSYVSYSLWDWRFLGLILGITVINYLAGWGISKSQTINEKRIWLGLAIAVDIIVLGLFKYFNFFAENLTQILSFIGLNADPVTLKIILPLGISFFIFMSITYPFDIYRGKLTHTRRFLDFALFVSFFPTLVSGPVERAHHLLPQFQNRRVISSDKINEGIWLILWGYFQKVVIADNLGLIVNQVYGNYTQYQGLDIIIAILAYSVQILADFGGYTNIARGIARVMGFDLLLNFNLPYMATNPSDFWSRWHMSLSSWFRDYMYIPLGGNRKGLLRTCLNLILTMVLVGLWHGAALTFIVWGLWHGLLQVFYLLIGQNGRQSHKSQAGRVIRIALMFIFVAIGWAVFRATSLDQAFFLLANINLHQSSETQSFALRLIFLILPLLIIQDIQFRTSNSFFFEKLNPWLRGMIYGVLLVGIIIFSHQEITRFIYQGF